jgi:hypothetical protein
MVEVKIDGRSMVVRGRVAAMIQYLTQVADRINEPEKLRLEFNCFGFQQVKSKLDILSEDVVMIK